MRTRYAPGVDPRDRWPHPDPVHRASWMPPGVAIVAPAGTIERIVRDTVTALAARDDLSPPPPFPAWFEEMRRDVADRVIGDPLHRRRPRHERVTGHRTRHPGRRHRVYSGTAAAW